MTAGVEEMGLKLREGEMGETANSISKGAI
jgi:hypothetical protein